MNNTRLLSFELFHQFVNFYLAPSGITHLSIYSSKALLLSLGRFFSFLILYTVGRTPWMGDQPVARPKSTHRTTQTQNKCRQTSMPWVGFESTIPAFEREKTVHALDRAAIVIVSDVTYWTIIRPLISLVLTASNHKSYCSSLVHFFDGATIIRCHSTDAVQRTLSPN
jgi:hypothetical protein